MTRTPFAVLASIGLLMSVAAPSLANAAATGTLTFTQPSGSVASNQSIDVGYTVVLDPTSSAIITDGGGNVISGVTDADLIAAGIDPTMVARSNINTSFLCSGTFTTGCSGPPYNFDFAGSPSGLNFATNLDIEAGTSTDFLFGTFAPTHGVAPYGTYTFYDATVFAQFYDAQNNHLGDVTFFDTCGSQQASCAFTRTVDSGPISGAVPEPAAWALLIAGFGGVGGVLRRQRRHASIA